MAKYNNAELKCGRAVKLKNGGITEDKYTCRSPVVDLVVIFTVTLILFVVELL